MNETMRMNTASIHVWGQRFARSLPWIQLATGLVLLALGAYLGRVPFELLRSGESAMGRVVRFDAISAASSAPSGIRASSTSFYPVVAFEADGRRVEFRDRFGSASAAGVNDSVAVLFLPRAPETAMIHRPVRIWMPWAPTLVVGAFLVMVGLIGAWRGSDPARCKKDAR
ncbi:DUF3592 domain-containing protein [Ramlibacter sp. USB13]|uniref:DUF3592 domain-containing protein n=1 Tax=Ramlibacter cellulosilyticus TaxID=2764187 RepID=A0A923MP66_9BURK|nr:DUF3592 domain-containing protein [Ramlibacter cellulosilyticus]MBC5782331.1 DUF3592 domain-containing protein [Ramlibacter cellulosilyticus]